jgi:hypothetical protein
VPTSVQSALLKLGETPDPLYDANTWNELQKNGYPQELSWQQRHTRIEMNEWWFARQFELPKDWDGHASIAAPTTGSAFSRAAPAGGGTTAT